MKTQTHISKFLYTTDNKVFSREMSYILRQSLVINYHPKGF